MPDELEGELTAGGCRLAIVVSRFNSFITEKLLSGALETYRRHGGDPESVTVARVPGSLELGLPAKKLAASGKYDAVLCIGCVIRGDTAHYDCVVDGTTKGVTDASMQSGVPVIFGVLTCDTVEQAVERAGTKMGNAGSGAVLAAVEMANLMKKL